MLRVSGCIVLAAAVLFGGCDLFEDEVALEIKTDKSAYFSGSTVEVTAKNHSSDVIYYNSCMGAELQEVTDNKVVESMGFPSCDCLCVTELKPGETWEWRLDSQWLLDNDDYYNLNIGPRYRLLFHDFYKDREMSEPIIPLERITNTFRFASADAPAQ